MEGCLIWAETGDSAVQNAAERKNKGFTPDSIVQSAIGTCLCRIPHQPSFRPLEQWPNASASASIPTHSYNAAKGGVIHLTQGVAATYAKHGITVNAIGPSLFHSEMTEHTLFTEQSLRMYTRSVRWAGPAIRGGRTGRCPVFCLGCFSYTTGQTLFVDGGWTIV